jgi:hypothetical protein
MGIYRPLKIELMEWHGELPALIGMRLPKEQQESRLLDPTLAKKLVRLGSSHAKFSRGIVYYIDYSFQVGFMIELDTYRIGREVLSTTSTMHNELLYLEGPALAEKKQADLPDQYYRQIAMFSAQCLRKIYIERRAHRHPDWQLFCDFIETLPSFTKYIMPEKEAK